MRLGFTCQDRFGVGGVQTWTRTMERAAIKAGHDLSGNAPIDLAISAHGIRPFPRTAKRINVCHGIIEPERPDPEADRNIGVSPEVCFTWNIDPPTTIDQPIELDFWGALKQQNTGLIVRWSRYGGMKYLDAVCRKLGYEYLEMGQLPPDSLPMTFARDAFAHADLVIATGRSALEAAAAGCRVLVADSRFYNGGPLVGGILGESYEILRLTNFSGRGGEKADEKNMEHWIQKAVRSKPDFPRENHQPSRVLDAILAVASGT